MSDVARNRQAAGEQRQVEADLRDEVEQLARIVEVQERTIADLHRQVDLHSNALGWRVQRRVEGLRQRVLRVPVVRSVYRALYRGVELWADEGVGAVFRQTRHKIGLALRGRDFRVSRREPLPPGLDEQYELWLRHQRPAPELPAMRAAIEGFRERPLISVLVVLDEAAAPRLAALLSTLAGQVYERWELCLAVPGSSRSDIAASLGAAAQAEPRLQVAWSGNGMPTHADALRVASGDVIGFLDSDSSLEPHAFFELVQRLDEDPAANVVYSDEDEIASSGRRVQPFFKPDWSPDLLLSTNYLEGFGIIRRRLVEEAGIRPDLWRGQAYDLVLRVSEATSEIAHVPQVLCHRGRRPASADAILARRAAWRDECRALDDALRRRGRSGRAAPIASQGGRRCYTTRDELRERPLVSIIIPTRNNRRLLQTTIESIQRRTAYERYEIVVIDNASTDEDAVRYLQTLQPSCQVLAWPAEFNYSAVNNLGASRSKGAQLLFLNNDVEVIASDWLTAMLEHAQRREVGAVGARLLYEDGRIQHAGVVVGINRSAGNAFRSQPGESAGSPRLADLVRNCSAVTGACMMVPRRVFEEVGGFDAGLRVVLNDVDLCLRIRQKGYLVVYTPHAQLYHYEGSSRGMTHPPADQKVFEERWRDLLDRGDPYYNPNLTYTRDDWSLRD